MTGRRGGVSATNYVLHIDDPARPGRVYCGRIAAGLNRTPEPDKLCEDEGCRKCVAARARCLAAHREHEVSR